MRAVPPIPISRQLRGIGVVEAVVVGVGQSGRDDRIRAFVGETSEDVAAHVSQAVWGSNHGVVDPTKLGAADIHGVVVNGGAITQIQKAVAGIIGALEGHVDEDVVMYLGVGCGVTEESLIDVVDEQVVAELAVHALYHPRGAAEHVVLDDHRARRTFEIEEVSLRPTIGIPVIRMNTPSDIVSAPSL